MAIPSLLGSYIDQTYQRLVQTTGSGAEFADGLGNPISFGGATAPGGSNTQIQFNSASKFAADSSFVFDYTKKSLVLGTGNTVFSPFSFTLGTNHSLFGTGSFASGDGNSTNANYTHVEGLGTYAGGIGSHAEGELTNAYAYASHTEGHTTSTLGSYAHAEGESTSANGYASHTEGYSTIASNDYAHAEGNASRAEGNSSHAEGASTISSGIASHAEGNYTTASFDYSHAEGQNTWANGQSSHAEGYYTVTSNDFSHAEGHTTKAIGANSHAEGYLNITYGEASHAEGTNTFTGQLGYNSTSIITGEITLDNSYGDVKPYIDGISKYIVLDDRDFDNIYGLRLFEISSISSGTPTLIYTVDADVSTTQAIIGVAGVAQPTNADTTIAGRFAHSEGNNTIATGYDSHATGQDTNAVGYHSYTGGKGTIAYRQGQTAVGQYNRVFREDNTHYDYSFVVGKGTSAILRDNIFEVLPTQNTINLSSSLVYVNGLPSDNTIPKVVSIDTTDSGRLYITPVSSIRPKAGSIPSSSFSGTVKTCSVSLNTPFPDNNYAVTVTGTDGFAWSIISKASGSFGISSNSTSAITGPVYWIATPFNNS